MTIHGESLVLAKTDPGNLCFDEVAKGSVAIRSTYRADSLECAAYEENVDYTVDYANGTIARTENSTMPDFSKNVLYGQKDFDHEKFPGYTNHPFFVWVDYTRENGRAFADPSDQAQFLTKTRAKLEAGGPFVIVSYGDSITHGGEASTPEMRFQLRYIEYLRSAFPKANIDHCDASPGSTSARGVECWDKRVGNTIPDLVLVGFGMNDHNISDVGGIEPDVCKKNLINLVDMIQVRDGAEAVLLSAFPPHEDWHYGTHRHGYFCRSYQAGGYRSPVRLREYLRYLGHGPEAQRPIFTSWEQHQPSKRLWTLDL